MRAPGSDFPKRTCVPKNASEVTSMSRAMFQPSVYWLKKTTKKMSITPHMASSREPTRTRAFIRVSPPFQSCVAIGCFATGLEPRQQGQSSDDSVRAEPGDLGVAHPEPAEHRVGVLPEDRGRGTDRRGGLGELDRGPRHD